MKKYLGIIIAAALVLSTFAAFAQYRYSLKKAKKDFTVEAADLTDEKAYKSFVGGNAGFMVERIKMDCSSVTTRRLAIAEKLTDCQTPIWYADNAACQIKIETPASETSISYEPAVWVKPESGQLLFLNFQGVEDCKISIYGDEVWQ